MRLRGQYVPGLETWLGNFSPPLSPEALMTTERDEQYVPTTSPLTSKVWWRSRGCQPFALSLSELGHASEIAGSNFDMNSLESHDVSYFVSFGALFKLVYLGPAVKTDAVQGTVQYVMDEHAIPDPPSRE